VEAIVRGIKLESRWVVLAAILLLGQAASADMLTITSTVSWTGGEIPWSAPINIAQFDPTLGTLVSVQLDFSGASWGTMDLTYTGRNAQTLDSTLGARLTLSDTVAGPIATITPGTPFSHAYNSGAHKTATQTVLSTQAATASSSILYTSDLTRWIGLGNWIVTGSAVDGSSVQSGQLQYTADVYANATLKVTYDYTPASPDAGAPEPAAFLLIGSGLVALGVLLRRRIS
jgi:hypothetical protein